MSLASCHCSLFPPCKQLLTVVGVGAVIVVVVTGILHLFAWSSLISGAGCRGGSGVGLGFIPVAVACVGEDKQFYGLKENAYLEHLLEVSP